MELLTLGYTPNWVSFNFLTEELLTAQLAEFAVDETKNPEHYRYYTFVNWVDSKTKLTAKEIDQFLKLARADEDQLMAGSAVRYLFSSTILSEKQFEGLKPKLTLFGDWTKKLIERESLARKIRMDEITAEVYLASLKYKLDYDDNRLLVQIIEKTTDETILADFETNGCGKRIRTLAEKKLNRLRRAAAAE